MWMSLDTLTDDGYVRYNKSIPSWVLTQLDAILAVHIEGLVAFVLQPDGLVEDQTVGADALGADTVDALVVFVALHIVAVLAVLVVGAGILVAGSVCKSHAGGKPKTDVHYNSGK